MGVGWHQGHSHRDGILVEINQEHNYKSYKRDILLRSIQSNFFGLEWKNRLKWAKNHCYTIQNLQTTY